MKKGDRVICDCNHIRANGKGTIIDIDKMGMVCVAFDDFPNVNHRDYHNRFWIRPTNLKIIEVEE